MTNDKTTGEGRHDADEQVADQVSFDRIEETIDVIQDDLDDAEEEVSDDFAGDLDDIEDRVERINGSVDDAQDGEGENPLGSVPSTIDYTQTLADTIEDATGGDAIDRVADGLETLEEHFDGVSITRTKWFAIVNGFPEVYDTQTVSPDILKEQGDIDSDSDNYALHALPTPTSDIDESIATFPPEDDEPIDLDEYQYFVTEKEHGGVV